MFVPLTAVVRSRILRDSYYAFSTSVIKANLCYSIGIKRVKVFSIRYNKRCFHKVFLSIFCLIKGFFAFFAPYVISELSQIKTIVCSVDSFAIYDLFLILLFILLYSFKYIFTSSSSSLGYSSPIKSSHILSVFFLKASSSLGVRTTSFTP